MLQIYCFPIKVKVGSIYSQYGQTKFSLIVATSACNKLLNIFPDSKFISKYTSLHARVEPGDLGDLNEPGEWARGVTW